MRRLLVLAALLTGAATAYTYQLNFLTKVVYDDERSISAVRTVVVELNNSLDDLALQRQPWRRVAMYPHSVFAKAEPP
jgi:hypothetical protein